MKSWISKQKTCWLKTWSADLLKTWGKIGTLWKLIWKLWKKYSNVIWENMVFRVKNQYKNVIDQFKLMWKSIYMKIKKIHSKIPIWPIEKLNDYLKMICLDYASARLLRFNYKFIWLWLRPYLSNHYRFIMLIYQEKKAKNIISFFLREKKCYQYT